MATEITINLPEPLLKEARQAAEEKKATLDEFVSQAILAWLQHPKPASETAPSPWPKERMRQDRVWLDTHYQTLVENYPDQWVIVHGQKVCGAHRDLAQAEEEARQLLGDLQQVYPLTIFVEATKRVF